MKKKKLKYETCMTVSFYRLFILRSINHRSEFYSYQSNIFHMHNLILLQNILLKKLNYLPTMKEFVTITFYLAVMNYDIKKIKDEKNNSNVLLTLLFFYFII